MDNFRTLSFFVRFLDQTLIDKRKKQIDAVAVAVGLKWRQVLRKGIEHPVCKL